MKKGFTLIELLIVIAIIGILAVAFLPSLLNAPAKGRDATRIADLQKIQKVLISRNLVGLPYPKQRNIIGEGSETGLGNGATWGNTYKEDFGGKIPLDPKYINNSSPWKYYYLPPQEQGSPSLFIPAGYIFAVYAKMETKEAGNVKCIVGNNMIDPAAPPTSDDDSCYIILVK